MNMSLNIRPSLLVWKEIVSPTKFPGRVNFTIGPALQSTGSPSDCPAWMNSGRMVSGMSLLRWTGGRGPCERKLARAVVRVDGVGRSNLRTRRLILGRVFLPDIEQMRHRPQ